MDAAPFLDVAPGGRAPDLCFWLRTADGLRLRAACWTADTPVAHAVILTGRTEYLEKTAITAAGYAARGISAISLDWRGQGLSDREADDPLKGHVNDFADFQQDLDAVLAVMDLPGPRILHGHSMGGLVGVAALLRPDIADGVHAAVLTAPMFGISLPAAMRPFAWVTTRIGAAFGLLDRWPPLGDVTTPYALQRPDQNVLTHDADVWHWLGEMAERYPELSIAMPTIGWFHAADREMRRLRKVGPLSVSTLCLLGAEEEVVDVPAIRAAAHQMAANLAEIQGGRHEVLIEAEPARSAAWDSISAFLREQGIQTRDRAPAA